MPYIHSNATTKRKFVLAPEAELMGLKFSLGHTMNLSRQDLMKKTFLTRSSMKLNQLTDLHALGDSIEAKLELLNQPDASPELLQLKQQWTEERPAKADSGARRFSVTHSREESFGSQFSQTLRTPTALVRSGVVRHTQTIFS